MRRRILVVDRSAVVRRMLARLVAATPDLALTAAVPDAHCARQRTQSEPPDILVFDAGLGVGEAVHLLHDIGARAETPIVVLTVSDAEQRGSRASSHGGNVFDVVVRPRAGTAEHMTLFGDRLIDVIRGAGQAQARRDAQLRAVGDDRGLPSGVCAPIPCGVNVQPKLTADVVLPAPRAHHLVLSSEPIVAIGTSTGGTQALEAILTALPADAPPIVIVQHMPERFTAAFASRLDAQCAIDVREACDNERVQRGCALIAPGGHHMVLRSSGTHYYVGVVDAPPVNRHRPSVDVLFRSVASVAGRNALGIIMTGMGDDGAAGLAEMRAAGARTLAQDEASCAVYGMPREAVRRGAVEASASLDALADAIMQHH